MIIAIYIVCFMCKTYLNDRYCCKCHIINGFEIKSWTFGCMNIQNNSTWPQCWSVTGCTTGWVEKMLPLISYQIVRKCILWPPIFSVYFVQRACTPVGYGVGKWEKILKLVKFLVQIWWPTWQFTTKISNYDSFEPNGLCFHGNWWLEWCTDLEFLSLRCPCADFLFVGTLFGFVDIITKELWGKQIHPCKPPISPTFIGSHAPSWDTIHLRESE